MPTSALASTSAHALRAIASDRSLSRSNRRKRARSSVLKLRHSKSLTSYSSSSSSSSSSSAENENGEDVNNNDNNNSDKKTKKKKKKKKNLAVFISGGGSNMRAIHDKCESGEINAKIACVVTSDISCAGVEWALDSEIPVFLYPGKKEQPKEEKLDANELTQYLRDDYEVDIVVLAGYLRLIPKELCRAYENKMVNIHPSLLPSFGGKGMHGSRVHEEVLKSGARVTGPTVHFVNEEFDKGKIIAQRAIRINPSWSVDDLQREVLKEEHLVFPEVIKALCEERIEFRERDGVGLIQLSDGSFM